MINHGLKTSEARKKLQQYGYNELKELHKISAVDVLLRQIKKNFVLYLLFATAVASFLLGKSVTGYVIVAVILTVVITGFIQEFKAERAIEALKEMIMPISRLIRDGKEKEVPSREIVPEDVIVLRTGEKIPADCVIIEENNLKTNESILTGESADITKKAALDLQNPTDENMLYMGSYVVRGRCTAQVIHTGMNTKFGKIAGMISTAEKKLPLQDKVNRISKYMVTVGLVSAALTGMILFGRAEAITQELIVSILILVIALSVSSFPEGFPVVLITTLANGVNRMAKQNAVVNRMSIIETLGETTVICSDKTGTITKGEMTIRKVFTDNKLYEVSGLGYEATGEIMHDDKSVELKNHASLSQLVKTAVLCNDSSIERVGDDSFYKVLGSSTEGALHILAAKMHVFVEDFKYKKIEEIPFDSERKMMSMLYQEQKEHVVYAKGAPEILLQKCSHILEKGKVVTLTKAKKEEIEDILTMMTSKALRTLALAYKNVDKTTTYDENDLIFVGIVAMEDPPREEVVHAIAQCKQSGIQVKMITGDNKATAAAIAKQVGLEGKVMEGTALNDLSDEELSKIVKSISIFARVKPEHKLRIVKALKANGEIVTMTGDGVNDAPALKEAHIGVAMGINGTDVSRSVADITLKDDNFATIVVAVKEGRTIFNNIRKFVTYQLGCNLADIIILFIGVLLGPYFGWYVPIITALQILFMNLVTDNLPAITLGFTPTSQDIMKEKPRKNAEILTGEFVRVIITNGVSMGLISVGVLALTFNILKLPPEVARTTTLVSMIIMQIANAYNFRSFRFGVLNRGLFVNRYLVYASCMSTLATLTIVYSPLNTVFETTPLGWESWVIAFCAGLYIWIIFDILKAVNNKNHTLLHQTT